MHSQSRKLIGKLSGTWGLFELLKQKKRRERERESEGERGGVVNGKFVAAVGFVCWKTEYWMEESGARRFPVVHCESCLFFVFSVEFSLVGAPHAVILAQRSSAHYSVAVLRTPWVFLALTMLVCCQVLRGSSTRGHEVWAGLQCTEMATCGAPVCRRVHHRKMLKLYPSLALPAHPQLA